MKRILLFASVLAVVCLMSVVATAADQDVSAAVKALESHYGIKETHLPWIARAFVRSVGFAVFEDQPLPQQVTVEELDQVIRPALGPEWHSFVTVVSNRDGERNLIFARSVGKHIELFIVSAERDETSVVKVKLDTDDSRRWLQEPQDKGKGTKVQVHAGSN